MVGDSGARAGSVGVRLHVLAVDDQVLGGVDEGRVVAVAAVDRVGVVVAGVDHVVAGPAGQVVLAGFGPQLIVAGPPVDDVGARPAAQRVVARLAGELVVAEQAGLALIAVALVPATETFTVLRALRILRVLRLITAVPTLKRVVAGLLASLPGMGSIVFLIGLLYYVFAVMGTRLFGADNPDLFGTLGSSLFTLFTVMTLEGWVDGVTKPVMENHPYAWIFFFTFIVVTTFMVLNLFIGVVVNAMQAEAVKAEVAEREAEREMIQEEAAPILAEVKRLRAEVAALRADLVEPMSRTGG